jgi:toxin ParE1/3/4
VANVRVGPWHMRSIMNQSLRCLCSQSVIDATGRIGSRRPAPHCHSHKTRTQLPSCLQLHDSKRLVRPIGIFDSHRLERLFDLLAGHNPKIARERMLGVRRAFELLADHPLLGREAEDGRRELILSRGKFGYVAKHRWVPAEDVVLILSVRHQLEAGYKDE